MHISIIRNALLALAFLPALAMGLGEVTGDFAKTEHRLAITGRVSNDDERALAGAKVNVDNGGELLGELIADSKGRFSMQVDIGGLYGISITQPGFVKKRFIVDSRTEKPETMITGPFHADITLTREELLEGVDLDELDMPYALVSYSAEAKAFMADAAYIIEMQRLESSLMLGAARARKRAAEKK